MNEHLLTQFDRDLEKIKAHILEMGQIVVSAMHKSLDGLNNQNTSLFDEVINIDTRIDSFEVEIDQECVSVIVRRQPTAIDLRLVMGISKIVTDLERCGDEATKIARLGSRMFSSQMIVPRIYELTEMGQSGIRAVELALQALRDSDIHAATKIMRNDRKLDDRFQSLIRQAITFMIEDPRTISNSISLIFIAKAIERIGDHAKNIAENVIYIHSGLDVRHLKPEEVEKNLEI